MPSAEAQSFNRYSYVNNNPIVYVDPTGHFLDFIGDFFASIGDFFSRIWGAVSEAWRNVKYFFSQVGDRALMTLKGMFTDPAGITGTILSVALSWATAGGTLLMTLAIWAQAVAAGIAATSIASAAGVRDPVLLGIVGLMAGTAAVSSNTFIEYARSFYAWSIGKLMETVEGDQVAKWLAPLNSFATSILVNTLAGDGNWIQTPWGAADPVITGPYKLSEKVLAMLQELNDVYFPGEDVVVTGADRYKDDARTIRSATDDKIVSASVSKSPHLLRGLAVDFYVKGEPMSLVGEAARRVGFDWVKDDYVQAPHVHADLAGRSGYRGQWSGPVRQNFCGVH